MRPCPRLTLCLAVVIAFSARGDVPVVADEPALPTEGIGEAVPGPLALPARLPGPGGREFVRSVAVDLVAKKGAETLDIVTSYSEPDSNGPIIWAVNIHVFDRPGAAHEALHARLAPMASGPLVPWHERWQRVPEASGVLLRHSSTVGCSYVGVLRQSLVLVYGQRRRDAPAETVDALVAQATAEGKDLALRVFATVQGASTGARPMDAAFAGRVVVNNESADADRESRIAVWLEPGRELGDAQWVRLWVVADGVVQDVRTTGERLKKEALALIVLAKGTDPSGASVRVMRVVEQGPLGIEEIRVTVGPRGTRAIKKP